MTLQTASLHKINTLAELILFTYILFIYLLWFLVLECFRLSRHAEPAMCWNGLLRSSVSWFTENAHISRRFVWGFEKTLETHWLDFKLRRIPIRTWRWLKVLNKQNKRKTKPTNTRQNGLRRTEKMFRRHADCQVPSLFIHSCIKEFQLMDFIFPSSYVSRSSQKTNNY